MAENRVTAEDLEVAVVRASVPGDARITAQVLEVAVLKDVMPGASVRVTAEMVEVAILAGLGVSAVRSRAFIVD